MRLLLVLSALMGAAAAPLAAQEIRAAVETDTARVGDVVRVAVRVTPGPGARVEWPDTLPLAGTPLENAARLRARADTLEDGTAARVGVYAVTPWRTGELPLPPLTVEVTAGDSTRALRVGLPTLVVASVLPADTTGIEPRPARGVLGASWDWWSMLGLAVGLLAVLVALLWWWRRRRASRTVEPVEPLIAPRERALAALQEVRDAGLLERGDVHEFYVRLSGAVRVYAAALDGAWGEDLTTAELLGRVRVLAGSEEMAALREILEPADRVKFARRRPDRDTALAEWAVARAWVRRFDGPARDPGMEEAA